MTVARVRIGRVRMKAGGADLRVLHNCSPIPADNWRGKFMEHSRAISEMGSPGSELVGYLVIGVFSDDAVSTAFRWNNPRSAIPRSLMPAYVAEIVRRDMVTAPEADEVACSVVNRANGFEE